MNALMDDTYTAFRDNVAKARRIAPEQMPNVSKGRVFTGAQAVRNGLVDELGGLSGATNYVKADLGLQPADAIELRAFPRSLNPAQKVQKLLKQYVHRPGVAMGAMAAELRLWLREAMAPSALARMQDIRVE